MNQIFDLTYKINDKIITYPAPWHPKVSIERLGRIEVEGRETRKITMVEHIQPATFNNAQASRYLGISASLCRELVRTGEIPAIKISPRRWLVPKAALERLLASAGSK